MQKTFGVDFEGKLVGSGLKNRSIFKVKRHINEQFVKDESVVDL
jgi:hypothetical protein